MRYFANAKFREDKTLAIRRDHSVFTDIGNYAIVANFSVANLSFKAIRKNKILAKIKFSQKFPNLQYIIWNFDSYGLCNVFTNLR